MTSTPESAPTTVAVPGGDVTVGRWGDSGPVVLGLHGITAHHQCWPFVAGALATDHQFVAPDLRGRGGSRDLPGPYGMAAHADDAAAVLRSVTDEPAVVVGHSMGAFVALVLAHRHPALVRSVILVDGGLPLAATELETTRAALGMIRERLETVFPSPAVYAEFFRQHPAFARDWSPEAEAYALYDARPVDGGARASASVDAVLEDQTDILDGTALPEALAALGHPTTFLHAPRGFVDDPPGLYAAATVADLAQVHREIEIRAVDDVNHYTIVLSERGAAAVAAAVRETGVRDSEA